MKRTVVIAIVMLLLLGTIFLTACKTKGQAAAKDSLKTGTIMQQKALPESLGDTKGPADTAESQVKPPIAPPKVH